MSDRAPLVVRLNAETCATIPEERAILATLGARVIEIEGGEDDEILACARDCEALMVVSSYVRGRVIDDLRQCRLIARLGTGVDKIDVEAATRRGIMVTNLPDFCTEEVADHTLALLLSVARRLDDFRSAMQQGRQPREVGEVHRLATRTLGVVGFGRIGRAVGRRARAFGMRVLAVDPALSPADATAEGVTAVDLDTALRESDYLCLLCPLTAATHGLLTGREFRKMKPTAVLVNTGRGELVNEDDLVEALRAGVIRFAALDVFAGINVFAPEGFPVDHPLFALPNVILTPHVAAFSVESMVDQKTRGAEAVVDVLTGRWPAHLVNPEVAPWFEIARPGG
jgi:D-3-phosphoglycerate dehydrogenase